MTGFETWKNEVTTLGPQALAQETTSPGYRERNSPVETHLEGLWSKQKNGEQLTVFWNTRPAHHLNLLHSIYLEKLKQLQDQDFHTTILVFDKYHREVNQLSEPGRSEDWAIRFAEKLAMHGLDPEKTEILLETDFRRCTDPEELITIMITLSRLTEYESVFDPEIHEITRLTEGLVRNTIEIYYETILDCDIVLSGSADLDFVWRVLRTEIAEQNLFSEHEEPLVLGIPNIEIDGTELDPTETKFIGDNLNMDEIKRNLKDSEELRKTVFEYLLLPLQDGAIDVDGTKRASYEHISDLPCEKQVGCLTESLRQLFG